MGIFIKGMIKLIDVLEEANVGSEAKRIKKLFTNAFKGFVSGKGRQTKINFIEEVIEDTLNKSDLIFLVRRLQNKVLKKKKPKK